uniref:Uncharacterized protein n=1 Tax=Rheinheimera sp. BAL341 TaxID=1708203 RepID=A0A486XJ60_9GAMM
MSNDYDLSHEKFTIESFLVTSNTNHQYSSNEIYGNAASGITVETKHHLIRDTWVKPIDGGNEFQLPKDRAVLDVKPGHKITIMFDENANYVVDAINHSTGQRITLMPDKSYSTYIDDRKPYNNPIGESIAFSLFFSIPVVGYFFAFLSIFHQNNANRIRINPPFNLILHFLFLILLFVSFGLTGLAVESASKARGDNTLVIVMYIIGMLFVNVISYVFIRNREYSTLYSYLKSRRKLMSEHCKSLSLPE